MKGSAKPGAAPPPKATYEELEQAVAELGGALAAERAETQRYKTAYLQERRAKEEAATRALEAERGVVLLRGVAAAAATAWRQEKATYDVINGDYSRRLRVALDSLETAVRT